MVWTEYSLLLATLAGMVASARLLFLFSWALVEAPELVCVVKVQDGHLYLAQLASLGFTPLPVTALAVGTLFYHIGRRAGLFSRDVMLPGRIPDLLQTLTSPVHHVFSCRTRRRLWLCRAHPALIVFVYGDFMDSSTATVHLGGVCTNATVVSFK